MEKKYAYIQFETVSPLAIGCGISNESDKDIIRNAKEEPFIPATALTGVYRSILSKEEGEKYFGNVVISKGLDQNKKIISQESQIIVYDGRLCNDTRVSSSIRNGVGLDEYRTAIDGAKFDYEIMEPGVTMWTALEYPTEAEGIANKIFSAWKENKIIVGGKTTRGLGRVQVSTIMTRSFELPEQMKDWLDFDLYQIPEKINVSKDLPKECMGMMEWNADKNDVTVADDQVSIELTLDQVGPLSIRVYTTEVSSEDKTAPDQKQLTYRDKEEKEVVVIPGTSWAGVFRHHMEKIVGDNMETLYGMVKQGKDSQVQARKSKICFSETYFPNAIGKVVSRNAIDRFSGGASDTALFTEKMFYGGKNGKLMITIPKDIEEKQLNALAVSIADLNEGIITVGGEGSIGHGIVKVTGVKLRKGNEEFEKMAGNAEIMDSAELFRFIKSKVEGVKNV